MPDDIGLEIQVGLAQCFGIAGVLFALVAWRAAGFASILRDLVQIRTARDLWPVGGSMIARARVRYFQGALLTVAVVYSAMVWVETIGYLRLVDLLMHRRNTDLAVFDVLTAAVDRAKHGLVDDGLLATLMFLIEVLIGVSIDVYAPPQFTFSAAHPWAIPAAWRGGPEAMWEARLAVLSAGASADRGLVELARTGSWRNNWSDWSVVVATYHDWAQSTLEAEKSFDGTRTDLSPGEGPTVGRCECGC